MIFHKVDILYLYPEKADPQLDQFQSDHRDPERGADGWQRAWSLLRQCPGSSGRWVWKCLPIRWLLGWADQLRPTETVVMDRWSWKYIRKV